MFDEQSGRLREVLRVVRGPSEFELRARDFRLAGKLLDGESVEEERVRLILVVARRLRRGDERAHRPSALREGAAHFVERRARHVPLTRARVGLREIVEGFGARLSGGDGDGAQGLDSVGGAARVEGGDAALELRLRRTRFGEATEGVFVSRDGVGVALRLEKFFGARRRLFGSGGRVRRAEARERCDRFRVVHA